MDTTPTAAAERVERIEAAKAALAAMDPKTRATELAANTWTMARRLTLTIGWLSGVKTPDIANQLGYVSRSSVISQASGLKLGPHPNGKRGNKTPHTEKAVSARRAKQPAEAMSAVGRRKAVPASERAKAVRVKKGMPHPSALSAEQKAALRRAPVNIPTRGTPEHEQWLFGTDDNVVREYNRLIKLGSEEALGQAMVYFSVARDRGLHV